MINIGRKILYLIILVCGLLILIVLNNNEEDSQPDPQIAGLEEITGPLAPAGDQLLYENPNLGFSLIIPKNIKVIEGELQINIESPENIDSIIVNIISNEELQKSTLLNQELCEQFGKEFNKSLIKEPDTPDFEFTIFSLNGILACRATGAIQKDTQQAIYVILNTANGKIYSIYYLATNETSAKILEESLNSFRFK